jgi:hypothetical protein
VIHLCGQWPSFLVVSIPSNRLLDLSDTSLEPPLNVDTKNAIGWEQIRRGRSERSFLVDW